jgi:hypothetical protein
VPAAACEFAAFAIIFRAGISPGASRRRFEWLSRNRGTAVFLAGLSAGFGFVLDYPALLIAGILGIYAAIRLGVRFLPAFGAGLIPGVAINMAYNYTAYHNVLATGYGHNGAFCRGKNGGECAGIGGFTLPPAGFRVTGMFVSR